MAESITIKALQDASLDAKSLEEVVNGNEVKQVTTRKGETYPSVKKAINTMFENGGLPATPFKTKALMTASPLVDGKYAQVTDDSVAANNGLYIKTAGAWVKSGYDPLSQSKAYANTALRDVAQVFDASAISNNYSLTLDAAIALVPEHLRKRGLVLRYNNTEEREYINNDIANWNSPKLWLRRFDLLSENHVNLFDPKMIYDGFTVANNIGSVTVVENASRGVAIVPIYQIVDELGEVRKLNLSTGVTPLGTTSSLFINEFGENVTTYVTTSKGFENEEIPTGAKYAVINLTNPTMINTARSKLKYLKYGSKTLLSKASDIDGAAYVKYGINDLSIEHAPNSVFAVSSFFKSGLDPVDNIHVAQLVKSVVIQKGQKSLVNKLTGNYRRFYVRYLRKTSLGVTFRLMYESEDGLLLTVPQKIFDIDSDGFSYCEVTTSLPDDLRDFVRVKIVVDANNMAIDTNYEFEENGEIHSSIVAKADKVRGVNQGVSLTNYTDYGVSRTLSNMQLVAPEPLIAKRELVNGFPIISVVGDTDKKHQQAVLMSSKTSDFYGKASIYIDSTANYPSNPKIKVLREPSSLDSSLSYGREKQNLLGRNDSQYIHPDICYAPEGVAGYKYWQINSNFPNGHDPSEDADLFVSNDGLDWKRVAGFYEDDFNNLGFRNPEVFWDTPNINSFLPCPVRGVSIEYANKDGVVVTEPIISFLNHDPAISCHNGYINVYTIHCLGFENANKNDYAFVICLRTNNGVDWEIVREDGSTMPYNADNAAKMYSKTGSVRNHTRMIYGADGAGSGLGFTPQVVKVSDTEWYYYDASKGDTVPSTGIDTGLLRYSGATPYTFDFTSPTKLSKSDNKSGVLWHFCIRYYDGIFYCVTNGYMLTSTDGINFTTNPYQFFWQGIGADLYKPTFVKGHDGKIKFVYSTQTAYAIPHPFAPQLTQLNNFNKNHVGGKLQASLLCEYASFADILTRSTTAIADAYVDVLVMCISQRTRTTQIRVLYGIRDFTELAETLEVSYDDEIYILAHLNTRNGGSLDFKGVSVTNPNVAELIT